MVQPAAGARSFIVHTTLVQLEGVVASVNGNRHWLSVQSSGKSSLRATSNILVPSDGGTNVGGAEVASALAGSVRVAGFSVNTVVSNDIFEGIVHQPSVAPLVAIRRGTVDQVLLRKADQVARLDLVNTLNTASGGEGPAASALALVLDASDGSLGPPVNGVSKRSSWGVGLSPQQRLTGINVGAEVDLSVFLVGEVSHVVQAKDGFVVDAVPGMNIIHIPLESKESLFELLSGIDPVVLVHPVHKGILVFLLGERSGNDAKEGEQQDCFHVCWYVGWVLKLQQ